MRPGPSGEWPSGALLLALVVMGLLVVYAALFIQAGYLLITALVSVAIAWLFGASPLKALVGGGAARPWQLCAVHLCVGHLATHR